MSDKRPAEDLSVEELEEILRRKRQEERVERLRRIASAEGERRERTPPSFLGRQDERSDRRWQRASNLRTMVRPPRGYLFRDRTDAASSSRLFRASPIRPLNPNPLEETSKSFVQKVSGFWTANRQRIRDGALLAVELGALLGLVLILISSFSSLRLLNQEVTEAKRKEALVATPTRVSILPGGSTPPDSSEAVPEPYSHLRDESSALIIIPTPGPQQASRIVIPSIGVDAIVVEGDGWEELKKGAGHHPGSANPGEKGNCVISAHNDIFGEIFRDIQYLNPGDEIILYAGDVPYKYLVQAKRVVDPSEVSVMDPTPDPIVTLITCHPYMIDTHRMVVVGRLAGYEEK